MLKSLSIENIAVIEKCNIDFSNGFNVLTGETGAGKSIIIDAINAVTGQRTSKELIRTGCDKGIVSALFDDISDECINKLSDYGVDASDRSVIMLRIINSDGRSVCKINGVSVNVAVLKEVGELLVNIHGQHDNQSLLNPENHCSFIDFYGKFSDVIDDYSKCYHRLRDVRKELKSLFKDENEKNRLVELLKYQISEIEAANISIGELDLLLTKRDIARNSEKLHQSLKMCHTYLSGSDDTSGANSLLSQSVSAFYPCIAVLNGADKINERLISVSNDLSELSNEISELLDSVSIDPEELEKCEQRIDVLKSLKRKYGSNEQEILDFLEKSKKELANIESSDARITELEKISDKLEDELVEKGSVLTNIRKKIAGIFSEKVCDVLKYLEMPNVVFLTDFKQGIYTANGCDKIEFLISANSGQEPKPLSKIASGGELSRIMLSIKSVLANIRGANTLIFDEIDTGISGRAADKVGRQLKSLSVSKQVLCVTHLAQIASAADNHLLITKSFTGDNTITKVENIKGDARISEIARIMSGNNLTENLYKSAKELLDNHS